MPLLARALRWLGATLLGCALLVLCAYTLISHTETGRDIVRRELLARLGPLLSGQFELDRIEGLSITDIELRGLRARDPGGALVLEVASARIAISPLRLLDKELTIDRVSLRGVRMDFADFGTQHGLLAALSPRVAAPAEESESPGMALRIADIALDDVAFEADVDGVGTLGATALSARAQYRQHDSVQVDLSALRAQLVRGGQPLAEIDSARGRYASAGTPSRLSLRARIGRSQLELSAHGRLPSDPEYARAALDVSLTLDALDRDLLVALGQNALAERLRQPLRAQLRVHGSVREPRAEFSLRAPAGALEGQAQMNADKRARLELSVRDLALGELLAGAPPMRVSLSLSGTAELARAPEAIPLSVQLSAGTLDGVALPVLTADAVLSKDALHALSLNGHGYGGTLALRGDANVSGDAQGTLDLSLPDLRALPRALRAPGQMPSDGSLSLHTRVSLRHEQIDAEGTLSARGLSLSSMSLRSLDATFAARGALRAPRIRHDAARRRAAPRRARVARSLAAARRWPRSLRAHALRARAPGRTAQRARRAARGRCARGCSCPRTAP